MLEEGHIILDGRKGYFLPRDAATNVDQCLVVFSTHNQGERFFLFDSLRNCNNRSTDILFLTDPSNGYYLSHDLGSSLIDSLARTLSARYGKNITFFGSSMAGYAAIHMALKLNTSFIVNNPQINLEGSIQFSWPGLHKTLSSLPDRSLAMDDLIEQSGKGVHGVVVYGTHRLDVYNVNLLIKSAYSLSSLQTISVEDEGHGFYLVDVESILTLQSRLYEMANTLKIGTSKKAQENIQKSLNANID